MRTPLMLIQPGRAKKITDRFRGITKKISNLFPGLRINLIEIDARVEDDEYIAASFISAFLYFILIFLLISVFLFILEASMYNVVTLASVIGLVIFALFFLVFLLYPGILVGKKAEQIDKDLVFALKDLLLEVTSGATVYRALVEVSRSGYGQVSKEFEKVVKKVDTGTPVDDALEELALRTTSEHFRNSIWQILNTIKAGSDIESAVQGLVQNLTAQQKIRIGSYAQELNVMILLYMLFAVVVPTVAVTLLIVIGPFMGIKLGPEIFYAVLPASFFIQIALVEFIKSRRPVVHL